MEYESNQYGAYPPNQYPVVPERNMLLYVASIVMIVLSAISLLGTLLLLLGFNAILGGIFGIGAAAGMEPQAAAGVGMARGFSVLIALFFSARAILELIAGILGLKGARDPFKARTCFVLGIVLIVLAVISLFTGGQIGLGSIVSVGVPVAYTVGASQVKDGGQRRS